jgi:CRP-like cAMP-binding protein
MKLLSTIAIAAMLCLAASVSRAHKDPGSCLCGSQATALTLAHSVGHEARGGIELHITNEDLANAANVTPFTASRLMSEWQRSRGLEKRRGKVVLRSPERLFLNTV